VKGPGEIIAEALHLDAMDTSVHYPDVYLRAAGVALDALRSAGYAITAPAPDPPRECSFCGRAMKPDWLWCTNCGATSTEDAP
jgi:hypothetical protein